MKKIFASSLLGSSLVASSALALIGVFGLAAPAAQAQNRDDIVVTMPSNFVVGDTTLPAGKYTLRRISDDPADGLYLANFEHHASVIVHPIEIEDAPSNKPTVSFQRVGGELFLNRIQTADRVYNLPVSRTQIMRASAQPAQGPGSPASGNSGSN
jgi:hypothetical protein